MTRAPQPATKQFLVPRQLRGLALGSACALLGLASFAAAARAEDNGVFGSMLKNFGLGGNNPIEYHERPPLVVPQTHDLPPPQGAARARDPNWPADPKSGVRSTRSDQLEDLDRLAVPQQPAGGPNTTASVPSGQPAESPGFFGRLFSKEDVKGAVPTTTPARKTLIEPPADYEQAAQPDAAPAPAAPGNPSGL